MHRVLRAAERPATPWRNGGGVTHEVAVFPAGAGTDGFDWRVSIAEVVAPGPFSCFDGVDRILTLIEGELRLDFPCARRPVTLTRRSAPCAFPGDLLTFGTPLGGLARDLNIMVRRGRWAATVSRHCPADLMRVDRGGDVMLLLFGGEGVIAHDAAQLAVRPLDAFIPEGAGYDALSVTSQGTVYAVRLSRVDAETPS